MAQIFTVTSNLGQVRGRMDRRINKLRVEMGESGREFCQKVANQIKFTLASRGHNDTMKTYNSVSSKKINNVKSVVMIGQTGIFLDSMTKKFVGMRRVYNKHPVKLWKWRKIHGWAMRKGYSHIKSIAERQGVIWVHSHPFIADSYNKTLRRLNPILRKRVKRGLEVV